MRTGHPSDRGRARIVFRRFHLDRVFGNGSIAFVTAFDLVKGRIGEEDAAAWTEIERNIRCDPEVMEGLPTFVGTRAPVRVVLDCLAEGMSSDEILRAFPTLKPQHIPAALRFSGLLTDLR